MKRPLKLRPTPNLIATSQTRSPGQRCRSQIVAGWLASDRTSFGPAPGIDRGSDDARPVPGTVRLRLHGWVFVDELRNGRRETAEVIQPIEELLQAAGVHVHVVVDQDVP